MTTKNFDLTKILFSLMFIGLMLVGCLWILRPFLPGLIWASMVVIATWPMMLKLQSTLKCKRIVASTLMTLIILLIYVIPAILIVASVIKNSGFILNFTSNNQAVEVPELLILKDLPYIGESAYNTWQSVIASNGKVIINQIQPYVGQGVTWLVSQAANIGRFLLYSGLMVMFSFILYLNGELCANAIRRFAMRLAGNRGDNTVLLAGQAIRAVALGVVVTALAQSIFAGIGLGIAGVPAATLLTMIIFILCVAQLGALPILVPAVIWLFLSGQTTLGCILLVWTVIVTTMDAVLRPFLIKMGADLPMLLILGGVIGGLLGFGLIGLFIGPVVLAVSFRLIQAWVSEQDEMTEQQKQE
ncbi:AI-2E family transporter YdiK [Thorsellia anophelis]|uniref:Predicted PurR-regulated permease PerM n=1 Tax=Thorsellia anophelis DSM 18579 TaxID=1123402 RepID=A0A1I0ED46_9GAMM|nr:AI-2E family transporter YdiK [Thorsellia anophelis]SET42983.1 Predicted PurR-regulated permease PerM [Thorsellia anophelis DSM 18579]